jgi:hypothetical protein
VTAPAELPTTEHRRPDPIHASPTLIAAVSRFGLRLPLIPPGKIAGLGVWRFEDAAPRIVHAPAGTKARVDAGARRQPENPAGLCALIYETRNELAGDPWDLERRASADEVIAETLNNLPETTTSYAEFDAALSKLRGKEEETGKD